MKQSRNIEVIHPTLRKASRRHRMPLANILTFGAVLMAVLLSVSLSTASSPKGACAMPLDQPGITTCD